MRAEGWTGIFHPRKCWVGEDRRRKSVAREEREGEGGCLRDNDPGGTVREGREPEKKPPTPTPTVPEPWRWRPGMLSRLPRPLCAL